MDEIEIEDKNEFFEEIFSTNDLEKIREALEEYPTAEVVEYLESKEPNEIIRFLNILDDEDAGRIFSDFEIETQYKVYKVCDKVFFARVFANMYSDLRADFFQELDKEEQIEFLPYLDKKIREDVIVLSAYPPDTAGGIMNTDFATVMITMTCQQALAKIRKDAPSQKMIYYIYVVNDKMELLGIITLKDLIM